MTSTISGGQLLGGSSGSSGDGWTLVTKSADTSRTLTTTAAADPHLVVSMGASSTYLVRGMIFAASHPTPDIKFGFEYATGTLTSSYWDQTWHRATAGFTDTSHFTATQSGLLTPQFLATLDTGVHSLAFSAIVNTNTAGTLQFVWAQNTSDANATTVYKSSYIEWRLL